MPVFVVIGQEVVINGTVINEMNLEKIAFAGIYIEELELGAYTDENGTFQLSVQALENYTLRVEHLGFKTITKIVSFNEISNLRFNLEANPIIIEEILVENNPRLSSGQSDIISEPTKKVCQPRDIGDMFKDVPGFAVVKRGGYAMDPVFRSFRNEQLNIQYDGGIQVMHACPNRMDPITTHVVPEEVEKIELIKGPFSVRYGQTMGGILNIITEAPRHDAGHPIGGSIEGGYEMNGQSKLTRASLFSTGEKYDLVVSGGMRDFGNYESGDNVEIPSSFKSYDYTAKLGWKPSDNQRLQLGWRQSFGRDIRHIGLPMDTEEDNSSVISVDYSARNLHPTLYSVLVKGFLSNVDHIMTNELRPNFRMMEGISNVDAITAGGKVEVSLTPGPKLQIYSGLDYRYLTRSGDRTRLIKVNMMTGEPVDPPVLVTYMIWQDANMSNIGVFTEARYFVSSKMKLTSGVRFDLITSDIQDPAQEFSALYPDIDKNTEVNVSGNISVDYDLGKYSNLEFALGRGTRAPSMEERYINHFQVGVDGYEYVGNPNLVSEANHQVELRLKGGVERFNYSVTGFYSLITDYITAVVDTTLNRKFMPMAMPGNAKRFVNIDKASQVGFELEMSVELMKDVSVYGKAAYTIAENLDWDEPLPEIPPFATTFGVNYDSRLWMADLRGRYSAPQDRIAESFGEASTPEFFVFDIRAGIRPFKGLSLGAAVLNVFDVNYYEHLNRGYRNTVEQGLIYEPGRNVTFYLKYEF
jgi:iron complex outermembrane receptor protein